MYKAMSDLTLKQMVEQGRADIVIKSGWEMAGSWSAKPSYICYSIGAEREHIFTCYFHREMKKLQITNIEATKLISGQKALVDAYMYVALLGIIDLANKIGIDQLVVDSEIPAAADHMLDLGFRITKRGADKGARGYKTIKD